MIKNTETIEIEVKEISDEIISEAGKLPHVYEALHNDGKFIIRCSGGKHNLIRVLDLLQNNNVNFGRVYSELPTLNDVFLEITGTALRDSE